MRSLVILTEEDISKLMHDASVELMCNDGSILVIMSEECYRMDREAQEMMAKSVKS